MSDVSDVWDPERLRRIGSVLERYGAHLKEGHRVRLGMEGDPCTPYRSIDEAPVGTVVSVEPPAVYGGLRRFTIKLDNDASLLTLDNRNVDPRGVWEIDPESLEEFRGSLEETVASEEASAIADAEYRGRMESYIETLQRELHQLREEEREFRSTTASTMRHIATDLLHVARGEGLEWVPQYAAVYDEKKSGAVDRYDAAADAHIPDFRGPSQDGPHQSEKLDFEESDAEIAEMTSVIFGGGKDGALEVVEDSRLTP